MIHLMSHAQYSWASFCLSSFIQPSNPPIRVEVHDLEDGLGTRLRSLLRHQGVNLKYLVKMQILEYSYVQDVIQKYSPNWQ